MPPHVLFVCSDHPHADGLRTILKARRELHVVGDVRRMEDAVRLTERSRPDVVLVAGDLPGRPLVALVQRLRGAGAAPKVIVIAERAALAVDTALALLDLRVSGLLAWEDLRPEDVPHCIAAILDGQLLVVGYTILAEVWVALERRRSPRVEGLVLAPEERVARRGDGGAPASGARRATLWADNPDVTASLRFYLDRAGLTLDVVDTAEALLAAAPRSELLAIDCTALPDALDRCRAVVPRVARPVLICHPDEDFVDDVCSAIGGELTWLPPEWLGSRVRDKLSLLVAPPAAIPVAEPEAASSRPLTTREREVLQLKATGCTNGEIADRLGMTKHTVKTHLTNARRKANTDGGTGRGTATQGDEGECEMRRTARTTLMHP